MYNARLYFETGFDAVNIPYDADVLHAAAREIAEYPTMDIITNMYLRDVRIRVPTPMDLNRLGMADYIEIYDASSSAYYTVIDMVPTSADVLLISIAMDPLLTFDAIGKRNKCRCVGYIDRRTHDAVQITAQIDPLLTPLDAPRHYIYSLFGPAPYTGVGSDVLGGKYKNWNWPISGLETIDIYGSSYANTIPQSDLDAATAPVTIKGAAGENMDVAFSGNYNTTRYSIGKPRTKTTQVTIDQASHPYPGLTFYGAVPNTNQGPDDTPNFLDTAQIYYNFGIPNPIAVSYQMPTQFLQQLALTTGGMAIYGYRDGVFDHLNGTIAEYTADYRIADMLGEEKSGKQTSLAADYASVACAPIARQAKLKLIATGTGQESTISVTDLPDADWTSYLTVRLITDPTPFGAPYYAWVTRYNDFDYPTDDSSGAKRLVAGMYGAVRGATWQPAPVSMSNFGAANELNALGIRQTYGAAAADIEYDAAGYQLQQQSAMADINAMSGIISQATGHASHTSGDANPGLMTLADVGSSIASITASAAAADTSLQSAAASAVYSNMARRLALSQELSAFNAAHQSSVIDIKYPVSQTLPQFTGNGAVIDVSVPSERDVQRYITIMRLFGVYQNTPVSGSLPIPDKSDINKYCFVRTRGLTIQGMGLLTRAAAESIAGAMDAGLRIWTTRPDMDPDTDLYAVGGN